MFKQFFEPILSKLGELIATCAHNHLNNAKDFKDTLETLRKQLKSLSAKAFDVEDHIKNAELSGKKKRKREVEEWLIDVKSIETEGFEWADEVESSGFIGRFMGGRKATPLIEEVDKLIDQSRHFGELIADVRGTRGETLPTTRMVGGAFGHNLEKICALLDTAVPRIGVYGMGGAGKTTLAKHVNNRLRGQSQGGVFWVTVSQEFTITSLQDKIARSVGMNELLDGDDEVIRAGRLHRALSQMKNSVLILDDVWEYIDLLKVGCPVSKEGCRLIITTRSLEVCHQIGCEERIAVQKLDEDEAWKLFSETLGEEIKLDHEVEKITKSVAKLCDGLPLGIVTLGGSMRGETAIHTWRNVVVVLKESMAGQDGMGEVEVFKVLKHSFDRLNKHDESERSEFNLFQLCFLYCSLYPEDHNIPREELVRKFISYGLLERRKSSREQVDQGHIIVDKLVKVCLLESCVDVNRIECVKMHDLVRLMALKIGGGKCMVRAGDRSLKEIPKEEEWTEDLEKVSLMYNGITRIGDGISPNCPNLSTLLLQGNYLLEVIPDSFFSRMQGLCTLDLCGTHITKLPDSLSDLTSLKALLLEECRIKNVPYLGKLKALRELNLSGTAIKEVPQGLEELLNLKILSIYAHKLEVLPRGLLLKLVHLQIVRFPHHLEVAIEEIENLKRLEEFWGRVKNVRDFNSFITSRVHDTFYRIQVGSFCEAYIGNDNKTLMLHECNLKDEEVLGQDIKFLSIRESEGLSKCILDDFSRLNNPTSLRRLAIERCGGIECILTSEQLTSARELASQFSSVEAIKLRRLEHLKGLIQKGEIGASPAPPHALFSSLAWLEIVECNKMRKLGLSVLGLPNLRCIFILGCSEIEEIFEDDGRASLTLPKLERFSLYDLPRLKSVCKATIICNSIEEISIQKCPVLMKKLPLHLDVPQPPSLREIEVEREWWESLEWDNPNLPTLLQPFLQVR